MNTITILAEIGNKYDIPNLRIWRKTFSIQSSYRNENTCIVNFDVNERAKLQDFFNRVNHNGGSDSFFIHFLPENKWIESRIIDSETDLVLNFMVYDEDKMIDGDIQDI